MQSKHLKDWLSHFDWTHIGTFTFPYSSSKQSAIRSWNSFLRQLRTKDPSVKYFMNVEGGSESPTHIHALLSSDLEPRFIQGVWMRFRGLAKVDTFKKNSGGEGYVSKRATSHWDIDV